MKKIASLVLLAGVLTGCSGAPSNGELQQALADSYGSQAPTSLDCSRTSTDTTGQGHTRWNYDCEAKFADNHQMKMKVSAFKKDGKLHASISG